MKVSSQIIDSADPVPSVGWMFQRGSPKSCDGPPPVSAVTDLTVGRAAHTRFVSRRNAQVVPAMKSTSQTSALTSHMTSKLSPVSGERASSPMP